MSMISKPTQFAPPSRPDKLSDGAAIMDLVARFDDAVNRKDSSEFGRLWAEDGVWEIGDPMPMRVQGREAIIATWASMMASTEWLFRGSFMGVVDITEDSATGRWPCVETGTFKASDAVPAKGDDNRAFYDDQYVKMAGQWFFQRRRYLYLWLSSERLPGNAVALHECPASLS